MKDWSKKVQHKLNSSILTFTLISIMVIIVSSKNGCTYTLDPEHHEVLYYHPLNSDGSYETTFSSYSEVEWDQLDEENVIEANRCVKMLKAEIELSGTD